MNLRTGKRIPEDGLLFFGIKKIDPEWNAFVKQNPELGLKKN